MDITSVKNLLEANKDDENMLKTIISLLGPVKINEPIPNDCDRTLLIWATSCGHEKIVAMLIAACCDLNKQNYNGSTALTVAASCGHEKIVAMLIAANCDLNKQDSGQNTALIWAAYKNYEKILAMLIAANCDLNKQDNGRKTALDYIKQKWTGEKRDAMIKLIEEKNKPLIVSPTLPTVLPTNAQSTTILTKEQQYVVCKFLIDNNVKFNVIDGKITLIN